MCPAESPVEFNARLNREEIRARKVELQSRPTRFNIDLSGICNLKCLFCHQRSDGYQYQPLDPSHLSEYESFTAVCEKIIDCSFGEPLTHPDFLRIAARFSTNQIFGFSTNGLLLTPRRAESLLLQGRRVAMNISLNAATEATYFKLTGHSLAVLLANLQYYTRRFREMYDNAPPIELSYIVMKINRDEVLDFLDLSHSLGIGKVNLRPLFDVAADVPSMDDFGYPFVYKQEMLSREEHRSIGVRAGALCRQLGMELVIHWQSSDSIIGRLSEPGVTIPCLFPWKFLFVQTHSRNVFMCSYSNAPVGNISKNALVDIWNGAILKDVRRSLIGGVLPAFCRAHGHACPIVQEQKTQISGKNQCGMNAPCSLIVMGENDQDHCGDGWHSLEDWPPQIRWTKREAFARIRLEKGSILRMEVLSHYPEITKQSAQGHIEVNGVNVGSFRLETGGWTLLTYPVCLHEDSPSAEIRIVVDNPWVPSEILPNLDRRELGIAIRRIWAE